jgi:group I intron endonuclease
MIVYTIRNEVNGKMYVGQTEKTVEQRWATHVRDARCGSQLHFHKAIRKYGPENFTIIGYLEIGKSQQQQPGILNQLEIGMIARLNTAHRFVGYNCTSGGEGGVPNAETRAKMSASARRRLVADSGYLDQIRNLPQTKVAQRASGVMLGRRNVESGQIQALGKSGVGARIGGRKCFELHGNPATPESRAEGGRISGRKNVESGHLAKCRHTRWHVRRGVRNPNCSFCTSSSAVQ